MSDSEQKINFSIPEYFCVTDSKGGMKFGIKVQKPWDDINCSIPLIVCNNFNIIPNQDIFVSIDESNSDDESQTSD